MLQINTCPNCLSDNIAKKFVVQDRHYGVKGDFNLDVCNYCGLIFLNPMPNDDELSKFYPEESYYAYHMGFPEIRKVNPFKKFIKRIFFINEEEVKFDYVGKVLDIGCGNGWVLYQYKQKGWDVAGVEPSRTAAEIGNKANLNIYNGILLDAKFSDNEFDFIRSNHSFEHIFNPNEVLNEIYRILKPGGKLLIGIPNYAGINSKLAKKYWYYLGAPVHTFNYTSKNIKQLLVKHNFRIIKLRHVSSIHGILGSVQIFLNRKNGKTSDKGFVVNSKLLKFFANPLSKVEKFLRISDCIEVVAEKGDNIL